MPGRFLTDAERERLRRFPTEVPSEDLVDYFTLSDRDQVQVRRQRGSANRLGFALQLCTLRYLGFVPDPLCPVPTAVIAHLAQQLRTTPESFAAYGDRPHTRTDHLQEVTAYLGFRKARPGDLRTLKAWLVERALEHDRPTLLLQLACEKLRTDKVVRPGPTRLERLVVAVRQEAQQETFRRLEPLLTDDGKALLDSLLVPDASRGGTTLTWLRRAAVSNSPKAILRNIEKLEFLKGAGVARWTLDVLSPNRLKRLAQIARRATGQALQRMPEERRYPLLVAFLRQSLVDVADETIDQFDRCLAEAYARAGHDLEDFCSSVAQTTNETVRLFGEMARIVLDPTVRDAQLRHAIYRRIPATRLQKAVEESTRIVRPDEDSGLDFLRKRYGPLRRFVPAFLAAFPFRTNVDPDPLLEAVDLLRRLSECRGRSLPRNTAVDFVPPKWRPYVIDGQGRIDRAYFELCVLSELRAALRAGDVWLESSRRYSDPETYLIPRDRWTTLRSEVCQQLQVSNESTARLMQREAELEALLERVDPLLDRDAGIRMEDGDLIVTALEAEERPESAVTLERLIDARLPQVELSELLVEVDGWTDFSGCFEHASDREPRSRDLARHLYASILAQGCNLGLTRMAQICDHAYDRLAWCTTWYLREETLRAAVAAVVNFQHHQPMSRHWGGGTLSSSDGQRFPTAGKVRNATALPRYFGYGKGVTFYTWTSDQFSQYGTKVVPATVRDATYVLDEILDNETELLILEHTTDTAGYTEIVFALFDLLGLQFSPRIRDLGDQQLYHLDRSRTYPNLQPRLKSRIRRDLILRRWDDLLRVAGSLKRGWVTASLLISRLQSYRRQPALTRALQEYGRLIKTIFILRYLESEQLRRRIHTQINKGEALHALREFLFFANRGKIRRKQEDEQVHQAMCLNLLTNVVIAWNTVYMAAAIDRLRIDGHPVQESDLTHLSPCRYEHINPYGKYAFEVSEDLRGARLRPLRSGRSPA
jgi:TnpA family transposase